MGGNSTRAIRRAVESCQGWAPFRSGRIAASTRTASVTSVEDLAPRIELARRHAAAIGRTEPLDICFSAGDNEGGPDGSAAHRRELVRLGEAGVTWVSVAFDDARTRTRRQFVERARRYADEVLAPLRVSHSGRVNGQPGGGPVDRYRGARASAAVSTDPGGGSYVIGCLGPTIGSAMRSPP